MTVENDVTVANKVSAGEFVTTSPGNPVFDSASTITLKAPDGVLVEGELKLQTNNITGIGTVNGYPIPYMMGVLQQTGPVWSGGGVLGYTDNGNGDITINFTDALGTTIDDFQVLATVQDKTSGHMVTISKPSTSSIRVIVEDDTGTGIDSKVFMVIYKVTG